MSITKGIKKEILSRKRYLIELLLVVVFLLGLLLLMKSDVIYPHSLEKEAYKYYLMKTSIRNGNDFRFTILGANKRISTVYFINGKDSLTIKVDPLQKGTILIVKEWGEPTKPLFPVAEDAILVEIVVETEEMKKEWEEIIKEAVEKEENLLEPRNVIPVLI